MSTQLRNRNPLGKIVGLPADAPFPALKEKLALFVQFVGDWDIVEAQPLASWNPGCSPWRSAFWLDSGWTGNSGCLDGARDKEAVRRQKKRPYATLGD